MVETSGDTGPAAIAGVKGCPNVEFLGLYPHGRVSEVQECSSSLFRSQTCTSTELKATGDYIQRLFALVRFGTGMRLEGGGGGFPGSGSGGDPRRLLALLLLLLLLLQALRARAARPQRGLSRVDGSCAALAANAAGIMASST